MTRTILVTGACGFIGSHLAERCVQDGFAVRAFDRYNPNNNWGWLETSSFRNEMEVLLGDVRDYDSVRGAMEGCEAVFHLAALIGIPYSYVSPLAYIRTNVEGTYNVLQAARELGTQSVVVTSTSETYGTARYVPMDEEHPLAAQSPYAASKIGADQLAMSFHRSFGLPVRIVRPFNVFGPRQSSRAVIPTVISQLADGRRHVVLGNLDPTRDFTYVEDTVRAMIAVERCESLVGETTHIGMNAEISIESLARKIARLMGREIEFEGAEARKRRAGSEVERLWCDNNKILRATSWRPSFDLEAGLRETITWVTEHSALMKSERYCI